MTLREMVHNRFTEDFLGEMLNLMDFETLETRIHDVLHGDAVHGAFDLSSWKKTDVLDRHLNELVAEVMERAHRFRVRK